jgi:WhiB family redox-sensing transcriptional regulator
MVAQTIAHSSSTAWEQQAACANAPGGTELFFSDELRDITAAKLICGNCPVLSECLSAALERSEQWGVWGGQLFISGKIVSAKRRRGRPPKHPRAEDQLPQIPFPEHLRHLCTA